MSVLTGIARRLLTMEIKCLSSLKFGKSWLQRLQARYLMSCLRARPSVHGRRLFELLEEKQEPFLLDIYLIENGYSDKPLACRSMCWPGNACQRMHRLASNGFRVGLFKCMFSNFLHTKSIRKTLKWNNKSPESRSLGVSCLSNGEASKTHEKQNQVSFSRGNEAGRVVDGEPLWKCMAMDEPRQLSPVSVLDLRSCEASPLHQTRNIEEQVSTFNLELQQKTLNIFEELLELAYTPAFDLLTKSQPRLVLTDKPPAQCDQKEVEQKASNCHECLRHKMTENAIHNETVAYRRRNGDHSIVGQMTVSELSKYWRNWNQFQHQEREAGLDIEDAIFDDIIEETVSEMLHFSCIFPDI